MSWRCDIWKNSVDSFHAPDERTHAHASLLMYVMLCHGMRSESHSATALTIIAEWEKANLS